MRFITFLCVMFFYNSYFSQLLEIENQKTHHFESQDKYDSFFEYGSHYYTAGDRAGKLHLLKFDSNFNIVEEKLLGSDNGFESKPMCVFRNDTIFIAISTNGGANGDINVQNNGLIDVWVLALDTEFNILWQNMLGGDKSETIIDIISCQDNNLMLLIKSESSISGNKTIGNVAEFSSDPWIVKLNFTNGEIINQQAITNDHEFFTEFYGGLVENPTNKHIYLSLIIESNLNNYFTNSTYGSADTYIVEFDESLSKIRDKNFGGTGLDILYISFYNNNLYLYGYSNSDISGNKTSPSLSSGEMDAWFLKLDEDLNILLDKSFGGLATDYFYKILFKGNNLIFGGMSHSEISAGKTAPHYGAGDVWIVVTDLDGNILVQNSYGGSGTDLFHDLSVNSTGNLILLSSSNSPISGNKTENSVDNDLWLLELSGESLMVHENTKQNVIDVFPNPFNQSVNFDLTAYDGLFQVQIMTLKGEILFDESISGGNIFTWNSSIANGLFIYKIVGQKTSFSGKIMKF